MILSLSRTRRRCSQSDMTELDEASGPVKDRRPSDSCLLLLLKNASVRNAGLVMPADFRPRTATEPPPTFPFLESQCQRAAFRHELLLCQRSNTARKTVARRAAWRGYIGRRLTAVKRENRALAAFLPRRKIDDHPEHAHG